jgi:cyanophycin synthetase
VLNADDPLVSGLRGLGGPVWYFSLRPRTRRIKGHLARGGRAYLYDEGWLVEADRERRRRIVAAAEVPATVQGLARHNVANALAAAAAARALGATPDQVAEGLRTFRSTEDMSFGRLALWRVDGRLVIVDFAHNEAGLSVVLDVADGLVGRRGSREGRLTVVVGTAGDRPDDTLRGLGRIAGERADRLAIKETLKYLRGRTRASVVGEIRAGMRSAGVRTSDVPVYEDEVSALQGELALPADGAAGTDLLVLLCHADREGVGAALTALGARPVDPAELTLA